MTPPIENYIDTLPESPIRVGLAPVQSAVHCLLLFSETDSTSGLSSWVMETVQKMSEQEKIDNNKIIFGFYNAIVPDENWESFPAYLAYLEKMDPVALRDKMILSYFKHACSKGVKKERTIEEVIDSEDSYLNFLKSAFDASIINEELERWAYHYVINPPAMKELIINHLNHMWDKYLKPSWDKGFGTLQKSVESFQEIDFSQMDNMEAAKFITGRQAFNEHFEKRITNAKKLLFVPSIHIGPYLGKFMLGDTIGIFFGARTPENVVSDSPELSQMDLYVRLNAMADETRLRILKYIAENGEVNSTEIISALDLSQSAASRHLTQLTATGFLEAHRVNSAKHYSLQDASILQTLETIKSFLNISQ